MFAEVSLELPLSWEGPAFPLPTRHLADKIELNLIIRTPSSRRSRIKSYFSTEPSIRRAVILLKYSRNLSPIIITLCCQIKQLGLCFRSIILILKGAELNFHG